MEWLVLCGRNAAILTGFKRPIFVWPALFQKTPVLSRQFVEFDRVFTGRFSGL
jgi:hypothetical protein